MTARLLLEYDGAGFAGWATQPGRRTVQSEVERALEQFGGEPVRLTVAGRTDAGVHARGQVASHHGRYVPIGALNARLPVDVRVLVSEPAADGFDARRDALARLYRYRIYTGAWPSVFERDRALHWRKPLDREALQSCAQLLLGRHDFTAFTPTDGGHRHFERTVSRSEWVQESELVLSYWIEADSFLHNMVRATIGTMIAVASGRMSGAEFGRLLDGRPRAHAGDTAAACGLYLEHVRYPEL